MQRSLQKIHYHFSGLLRYRIHVTTLCLVVVGCFLFGRTDTFAADLSIMTANYTIRGYDDNAIVLIVPHRRLSSVFATGGVTASGYVKSLSSSGQTDCFALNGFYFGRGLSGVRYQPAGDVTIFRGSLPPLFYPSTTIPSADPNLSVPVSYNMTTNKVTFNSQKVAFRGVRFFSGPMIVNTGVVNPLLTNGTSHRGGLYYRTFLIRKTNGKAIFGITTQKMTLTDLGQRLTSIITTDPISVVNLDGGPSTSFRHKSFSFNPNKILPAFFGLCGR